MVGIFVISMVVKCNFFQIIKDLHYDGCSMYRPIFKSFLQVVYSVAMTKNGYCSFWKTAYNSLVLYPMCTKVGLQTCCIMHLLPSKFEENGLKHTRVTVSISKKRRKHKETRQTLKAHISVMAWKIWLKFETGSAPPRGSFHSKNGSFLVKHYQSYVCVKLCFLGSYKYTLVCHSPALAVLGCMTYYRVLSRKLSTLMSIFAFDTKFLEYFLFL